MSHTQVKQIFPNAAGIDIGTKEFHVSTDGETVRVFSTFTESIVELIQFLRQQQTETVAMESTGVLWLPLYDMLEEAGFEVYLVNPAHVKNVPAQKTDFKDCRWLQKLHSFGFLRASFIPPETIRELRTYMRMREDHVEHAAGKIQQMQKALELMNIKLHNVISDLKGKSGLRIMEAILAGETNPERLANLCEKRILKEKRAQVIASLHGNYKKEYLFVLHQAYEGYKFYQEQITGCDQEIEMLLEELTKELPIPPQTPSAPARHNQPQVENLHQHLVQLTNGRNATVLPGLCDKTILKLISEVGTDLTQWESEKHFVSWLGLSPWKNQSGKTHRSKRNPARTVAGQIFRESALSISNSKNLALKGFYHRVKSRHGFKIALKATARKIAVLFYRFMTKGLEYVERGLLEYEKRYKEICIRNLHKRAKQFGFDLVAVNA